MFADRQAPPTNSRSRRFGMTDQAEISECLGTSMTGAFEPSPRSQETSSWRPTAHSSASESRPSVSLTERVTSLVKVLDEAVDAWSPVDAEHVGGDKYRLLGPIPEGEVWEFHPADEVHCRSRDFADSRTGLVAFARALRDA
jgi:hypothetical protein